MKAYLILENGEVFCGESFGANTEQTGELVFATGMGGYIETLTDPSYYGQIVVQTFPLIGNYGMISEDAESDRSFVKGYVVRDICDAPSNFRCEGELSDYLKKQNIMGISGVDTRRITKIIREKGVMNARITTQKPETIPDLTGYSVKDAVRSVGVQVKKVYNFGGSMRIALLDLGAKRNIVRELAKRGAEVTVLPYNTPAEEILTYDALMLSNGPGDPAENTELIETVSSVIGKIPIFGICLGHQILALACGGKTAKLKYGHRGVNQPVKDLKTERVYITSQNHGYAVLADTLPKYAELRYINVNDSTCEGIDYPRKKAFSVQFHPEACSGPHDTNFLFDKFISMIGGNADAAE